MVEDGYISTLTNIGRKNHAGGYALPVYTQMQLSAAYKSSWIARKIVDIPAEDSTRKWRAWNAEKEQISAIEAEENRHEHRRKVEMAISAARLYGGAAIYYGTRDQNPSTPLDLDRISLGDLEYTTLFSSEELTAGERETDIASPYFNTPSHYIISEIDREVHPSRLSIFWGASIPLAERRFNTGWGDSVLNAALDAIMQSDAATANSAELTREAKLDIIGIPDLMELLADPANEKKIKDRFAIANSLKSSANLILLDSAEEWEQKNFNFSGLPEILDRLFQNVSGAADIPVTRFFGKPAIGFNATGEHDLKNYYDHISAVQENRLRPALRLGDEIIIRSALGARPPELFYDWRPLWQVSEEAQAEIATKISKVAQNLAASGLYNGPAGQSFLRQAALNAFIESGTMPGIEDAAQQFDTETDPKVPLSPQPAPGRPSTEESENE